MKNFFVLLFLFIILSSNLSAEDIVQNNDTLYTELGRDIVILSTTKETNSLKSLPAAVSFLSQKNLESLQITSMKDLSAKVPNFFVPNYGSRMTAPLYIRGIGARTGTQTVSMYVDNIPYFNPSAFDSELYDIQRIEVLRGTQGTLYGRNAMGGILNIYTYSPLTYEGKKVMVSYGNYGAFSANISHYKKLTDNFGFSTTIYYKRDSGFFTNVHKGEKADKSETAGGRLKFSWQINPRFLAVYTFNFDFSDQGAFPYMKLNSDVPEYKPQVDYDGPGSYLRRVTTNGLSLKYSGDNYIINSTTGYQYLNDNMYMDQDYSPLPIFEINQRQKQHSLSQEVTIKSNTTSNYQWSNGIYGFYDRMKQTSPVLLLDMGIKSMLQSELDKQAEANPNFPFIKITNELIDLNSKFKRPVYGAAIFHQSTFNNLFNLRGLSVTAGLRLDYEKTELQYDANTGTDFTVQNRYPNAPVIPFRADTVIKGKASDDYLELLPKFVVKYAFNESSYIYGSVTRGYKAGGHNIQIFAEMLQTALQKSMQTVLGMPSTQPDINKMIGYKPEYSWNYEIGGQVYLLEDALSVNLALYYINVQDVQISKFAETGAGRMTTNAGKADSKGFELGIKGRPCKGFYLFANYGLAVAKFKDYKTTDSSQNEIDYSGNYIPFAPRQTFSIGGSTTYELKNRSILDKITLDADFSGAGRIYWKESNDLSQGFYGTMNARLVLEKSIFSVEFWGRNIFDRDYNAFYFESMGNSLVQKGRPAQWGATLRLKM